VTNTLCRAEAVYNGLKQPAAVASKWAGARFVRIARDDQAHDSDDSPNSQASSSQEGLLEAKKKTPETLQSGVGGSRSIQLSLRLSIRLCQKRDPGQRSTLP